MPEAIVTAIAPPPHFALPGGVYNATPPRIVFGPGAAEDIRSEVERLGAERALVLSTPGRATMAAPIVDRLGELCIGTMAEAISQVPIELARKGQAAARRLAADCLVSVGGGASIGLGKGIALELALPIVAVPTTYSGSEMTGFCGITIDGIKRMHTSLDMLAATVVYDPSLTVSLPLDVSMASAMNALAHCIDAIYLPSTSPVTAMAAVEGARTIMPAAARVARRPDDAAARAQLLYGAYLGGVALTGGFALQHGLAHVLGGSFGVPHGLSHAIVLPHVTAYNAQFAPAAVGRIADAVGVADLAGAIFDLMAEVGLPTSLASTGFAEGDLDRAATITVDTDSGCNPGPVTWPAVRRILDDVFHGRRPR